jgi:hypothetical protein
MGETVEGRRCTVVYSKTVQVGLAIDMKILTGENK